GANISGSNNLLNVNPMLSPLGDHGGPTETITLLLGSPAIDAGDPHFTPPPSTDQRGLSRVVDGRVAIGAIEVQSAVMTVVSLGDTDTGAQVLTLREALELQAGTLDYDSLTAAEQAQITGFPDVAGSNTIDFSVSGTIGLQAALPSLGNVSIDGPGA